MRLFPYLQDLTVVGIDDQFRHSALPGKYPEPVNPAVFFGVFVELRIQQLAGVARRHLGHDFIQWPRLALAHGAPRGVMVTRSGACCNAP